METPCPPFYAEPTHEQTLLFSTSSYVRNYDSNEWFRCIEGAYCNAPSFLGYNPPGEGELWEKAWAKLEEEFPCNAALEESTDGRTPAAEPAVSNGIPNSSSSGIVTTKRPTNSPTKESERPSLISGAVWYDSNGDGRKNSAMNAVTQADYDAASKEKGAGVSNMKVTLRECGTDNLLGVTYTFPRAFGLGGDGDVEVIDASYLEKIQLQQKDNIGYGNSNDGLGIGNSEGKLGYYSFRVLPNQIPGQFYVVFESPENYRLSGGSGDYWEVYEAAVNDKVQPSMEASWRKSSLPQDRRRRRRHLQANATMAIEVLNGTDTAPVGGRPQRPKDPINYSGYYAKSRCLLITESPTRITNIDAGLTPDSWPLVPHQYASLVVTIQFYAPRGRERSLQNVESLECRKYQKLKSEGIEVEDIWGCESSGPGGFDSVSADDFEELTLAQGDAVTKSLLEFLSSRVSRAWNIKLLSLAHQEMKVFVEDRSRFRRLLEWLSPFGTRDRRELQGNMNVADLELGFRIRAEYLTDKSSEDLAEVIIDSVRYGSDSFLSAMKSAVPGYFKLAGDVVVRDVLWTPEKEVVKEKNPAPEKDAGAVDNVVEPPPQTEDADDSGNEILGMPMGMFIGVIAGSVAFIAIVVVLLVWRCRKKNKNDGSRGRKSQKKASEGKKKWWQRNNKEGAKKSKATVKKKLPRDEESEFSSDYDDSYGDADDLSSRWYSDSSKFDPDLRRKELDAFKGVEVGSDGSSYESASQYSGADSYTSDGTDASRSYASYGTGASRNSYASRASGGPPLTRNNPRNNSVRSSGRHSRKSNNPRGSMTSGRSNRSSMKSHKSAGRYSKTSSMRSSNLSKSWSMRSSETSGMMTEGSDAYVSEASLSRISEDDYSRSQSTRSSRLRGGSSQRSRRS